MKLSMKEVQTICTDILFHMDRICQEYGIPYFAHCGTLLGAIRHKGPIPWDADVDIFVPEPEIERFVTAMQEHLPEKYWVDFRTAEDHPKIFPRLGLTGFSTESLHIDVFRLSAFPSNPRAQRALQRKGRKLLVMRKAKAIDPNYTYKNNSHMRTKAKILKLLLSFSSIDRIINSYDNLCKQYDYDTAEYVGTVSENKFYKKEYFAEAIRAEYDGITINIPREYETLLKYIYGDYLQYPPKEEQEKGLNAKFEIQEL